ncbi:MAG: hypothetical protein Q9160_003126 [Pyrenula sp. 1 TL-2023]
MRSSGSITRHPATSEAPIKKAYRKKALELHPDRNYGKVDEATRLFAAVQSAHEVLSDPQERAWYDSHRDTLLRGNDPQAKDKTEYSYNIRMTTAEEVTQLMLRFNGRLEMSDSPNGFFGGLRDFFEKLAKEEDIACNWEGLDGVEYPPFGHEDDDYHGVVRPFYAAWNGFATKKTYSWRDAYRLSDAPDRRVRRLMEKENRRLREEAIREFNDAVRSLVAFVRKRDTRYQENVKSEAERQQTLRDAAAAQASRSRAARQAHIETMKTHVVPEWAQSQHDDGSSASDEEEVPEEEQHFECVVCNKTFKSERQFESHEKSKKHIKLLKQLKKDMEEDDSAMHSEQDDPDHQAPKNTHHADGGRPDDQGEPPVEAPIPEAEQLDIPSAASYESSKSMTEEDGQPAVPEAPEEHLSSSSSEVDSDYASRDSPVRTESPLQAPENSNAHEGDGSPAKVGKAKQKRAKKAAQQATVKRDSSSSAFKCAACQADFPSKTKLFTHINDLGHAQPVAKPVAKGGKSKKK